jgi:predicted nucleotidyltransferase
MMVLPPDFKELLEEFARAGVEAVLVGGYAVAFHGRPRATKDIDLVLRHSDENLRRASEALAHFGAPPNVAALVRGMAPTDVVFLGQPPLRVDLLLAIDGVSQDDLFARSIEVRLDGVGLRVISRDDLIANKRAAGRPQDVLDAEFLESIRRAAEPSG